MLLCGFKTYLVRRRTKTQIYNRALFEQLESGWAYSRSVEDETEQRTKTTKQDTVLKQGK